MKVFLWLVYLGCKWESNLILCLPSRHARTSSSFLSSARRTSLESWLKLRTLRVGGESCNNGCPSLSFSWDCTSKSLRRKDNEKTYIYLLYYNLFYFNNNNIIITYMNANIMKEDQSRIFVFVLLHFTTTRYKVNHTLKVDQTFWWNKMECSQSYWSWKTN